MGRDNNDQFERVEGRLRHGPRAALAAAVSAVVLAACTTSGALERTTPRAEAPTTSPAVDEVEPSTSGGRAGARRPAPSPEPASTAKPRPEPEPTPEPVLERRDTGRDVRELQSRLKQLAWYLPAINGTYDGVTESAVRGFQRKRGFDRTGAVDKRTWRRIVSMSRTPTDDEMHNRLTPGPTIVGVGDSSPAVRELQARLKQIGWFNTDVTGSYGPVTTAAVSGFQVKRVIPSTGDVDQRTMDRLVAMTSEPTGDELFNRVPAIAPVASGAPLDPRCLTGDTLCVDKSSNSLSWVVDGSVQMRVDVRFGSEELPTREGEFAVSYKSRDHVSSLYDTSMPFAMFFSGGQAVHYSPDFAANGYAGASHGCVNVRDYAAISTLFDEVDLGDKVVVYWS